MALSEGVAVAQVDAEGEPLGLVVSETVLVADEVTQEVYVCPAVTTVAVADGMCDAEGEPLEVSVATVAV